MDDAVSRQNFNKELSEVRAVRDRQMARHGLRLEYSVDPVDILKYEHFIVVAKELCVASEAEISRRYRLTEELVGEPL